MRSEFVVATTAVRIGDYWLEGVVVWTTATKIFIGKIEMSKDRPIGAAAK